MGNRTPLVSNARVIAVDPLHRRLTVTLPSTQVVIVRMGISGPADGLRVSHSAMPGRGTEGIVLFPAGDNRNGIWICSLYVQQMDALTNDTDPFMEYNSHWSGHWHMLDGQGNFTEAFADGSFLQVGAGTAAPQTFRHTVDSLQKRQTTPLTQSERVPNPPKPFNITLRHTTGTTLGIDPAGDVALTGASGANLSANFGGTVFSIDKSGNVAVNGASGASLTMTFGGTVLKIDSTGVQVTGTLNVSGNITGGAGAGGVSLLTHRHGEGTPIAPGTSAPSAGT